MNKNHIAIFLAILVVASGGSFYGGMKYQNSKTPQFNFQRNGGNGANTGANAARFQQMGGNRQQGRGGAVNGQIIKKDDSSITVQASDGGSKLVYITDSTNISKSAQGSKDDLAIGTNVTVMGSTGSDGSVTGQLIQIRPATSTPQQK